MIFHENRLLADDSREISYLITKIRKDVAKLSSSAVVIDPLRVKEEYYVAGGILKVLFASQFCFFMIFLSSAVISYIYSHCIFFTGCKRK